MLKGKQFYEITAETPMGSQQVTVFPNEHVQSVKAEIMARDRIKRNIEAYELVLDGTPLDPLDLVRSAGIGEGDTVFLVSNPVSI